MEENQAFLSSFSYRIGACIPKHILSSSHRHGHWCQKLLLSSFSVQRERLAAGAASAASNTGSTAGHASWRSQPVGCCRQPRRSCWFISQLLKDTLFGVGCFSLEKNTAEISASLLLAQQLRCSLHSLLHVLSSFPK